MGRLFGAAAAIAMACGGFVIGAFADDIHGVGKQNTVYLPMWVYQGVSKEVPTGSEIPYGDDNLMFPVPTVVGTAVMQEPVVEVTEVPVYQLEEIPEQLSRLQMIEVLEDSGWPEWLWEDALKVARCESNWSPGAVGDGGRSLGLFQLNKMWFNYAGEDGALWIDPYVNARTAWMVWQYSEGWDQWTCKP